MTKVEEDIENYFLNLPEYKPKYMVSHHPNFTHEFKDKENKKILTIYRNRITEVKKFVNLQQKWEHNVRKYDKFFIEKIEKILKLHKIQRICFIWNGLCLDYNDEYLYHRPHIYNYKNNKWKKER